jgi:2-methylisocitrate lyase-like PEP mutase family enzyme
METPSVGEKRRRLRELLQSENSSLAPGSADVLTARLIVKMGFPVVYISGSLQHALRGYADINALTMSEMIQTAAVVANEIPVPCLADGETGFGTTANVIRTVREYERAGVAGIHIEDSTVPKKPSRLGYDSPTVTAAEFLDKIKSALDARSDASMVIVARSELRGDFSAKFERLQAAVELGADAFWAGGFTLAEVGKVCSMIAKPALSVLPKNVSIADYGRLGVKIAVIPGGMAIAGLMAQRSFLEHLSRTGDWTEWLEAQQGFKDANTHYAEQGVK